MERSTDRNKSAINKIPSYKAHKQLAVKCYATLVKGQSIFIAI